MFVILWLFGDILNVAGSILQGVLPTVVILAIYYTLADIILLIQIYLYNRRNASLKKPSQPRSNSVASAVTPLLEALAEAEEAVQEDEANREFTFINTHRRYSRVNTNPPGADQPTTVPDDPFGPPIEPVPSLVVPPPTPFYKTVITNTLLVAGVILAGVLGWLFTTYYHNRPGAPPSEPEPPLEFDLWGQIFGWGCAALYLSSSIPQIVLNFKRKSVEGVSFLFFLFACLGNLSFMVSILALDTSWRYVLINGSWLVGSLGEFIMDVFIFFQFWIYNKQGVRSGDGK